MEGPTQRRPQPRIPIHVSAAALAASRGSHVSKWPRLKSPTSKRAGFATNLFRNCTRTETRFEGGAGGPVDGCTPPPTHGGHIQRVQVTVLREAAVEISGFPSVTMGGDGERQGSLPTSATTRSVVEVRTAAPWVLR